MAPLEKYVVARFCESTKEARQLLRAARTWRAMPESERGQWRPRLRRRVSNRERESFGLALAYWMLTVGYEHPVYALLGPFAALLLYVIGFSMLALNFLGGRL